MITPFLSKNLLPELGVGELSKGKLFSTGQASGFTFVKTMIGASFIGDCVLYLDSTPCENIIFLGACGLLPEAYPDSGLNIGSIVVASQAFNAESFSSMVTRMFYPQKFPADAELMERCLSIDANIKRVNCISVGSIKLEAELAQSALASLKAEIVDLECSAVYCAARHIGRKAIGLMYITDIIGNKKREVFADLSQDDQHRIKTAQKRAAEIIGSICQNLNTNT